MEVANINPNEWTEKTLEKEFAAKAEFCKKIRC